MRGYKFEDKKGDILSLRFYFGISMASSNYENMIGMSQLFLKKEVCYSFC